MNCLEFVHENCNKIFVLFFGCCCALIKLWKPGDIKANIKEGSLLLIPLILGLISLFDIQILDLFIPKIKKK